MISEADRIKPTVTRLQAEFDTTQAALAAAQYERRNYSGHDEHTLAGLDLRVEQAQAALDAAQMGLVRATLALAIAEAQ